MTDAKLHNKKAIVIGAGVAGLAAAIRLAAKGFLVEVFERNSFPGGKLSWFEQDGYAFDKGPSLFTEPKLVEDLFAICNEPVAPYFSYEKVADGCHYFFENGKTIVASSDAKKFAADMQTQLGEPEANVLRYLQRSSAAYNTVGKLFTEKSLHKRESFLSKDVLSAIKNTRLPYLLKSLDAYNQSSFATPEAVQIFNRFATYNGSNPYKAPAMLSVIPHLELNDGVYYPHGGMISITNALYRLAQKLGIRFYFDTSVDSIVTNNGVACGITANNETRPADVVVSNCDVYFTYKKLLKDDNKAKQILKQERSSSAVVFYWGISQSFSQLGLHNIFFANNYSEEFDTIFSKKMVYTDPTVYINITSKMEAGQAPAGKENWFVMVNAPANEGQDWLAIQRETRANVLAKLSRLLGKAIEPLIETEAVLDPAGIEHNTSSYMGSLYGTSSNSKMAAFMRHANFSSSIKNLYFVGGSVHPGGGIPLCLNSARIMSNLLVT